MAKHIQQNQQPYNLNLIRIYAGFEDAQRLRVQMIAENISALSNSAHVEIERDIINRYCDFLLPITFRDWMCKP